LFSVSIFFMVPVYRLSKEKEEKGSDPFFNIH
jgi:hypothetical protein